MSAEARGSVAALAGSGCVAACPKMINAVLFDLFETLITEVAVQPTRASSLAQALGLRTKLIAGNGKRDGRASWWGRCPSPTH